MNLNYFFSKFSFLKKMIFWTGMLSLGLLAYVVLKQQHDVLSPAAKIIFDSISSFK